MFGQISCKVSNENVSVWKKSIPAKIAKLNKCRVKFSKFQNAFKMTYMGFLYFLKMFKQHIYQQKHEVNTKVTLNNRTADNIREQGP